MNSEFIKLHSLASQLAEKMFPQWPMRRYNIAWQYLYPNATKISYHPLAHSNDPSRIEKPEFVNMLAMHFQHTRGVASVYERNRCTQGAMALMHRNELTARFFCLDIDFPKQMKIVKEKFIPHLEEAGFPYTYELGGSDRNPNKAHIWMFFEPNVPLVLESGKAGHIKVFSNLLMQNTFGPEWKKFRPSLEVFPAFKQENLIRLPGGAHLRQALIPHPPDTFVNPVIFNGKEYSSPLEIMQALLACPPISTEALLAYIAKHEEPDPMEATGDPETALHDLKRKRTGVKRRKKEGNLYIPRTDLEIPKKLFNLRDLHGHIIPIPRIFKDTLRSCQAINELATSAIDDLWLDDAGDDVHNAGLLFNGIFHTGLSQTEENRMAYKDEFFDRTRFRDSKSHNWHDVAYKFGCEKIDDKFGLCKGCKFRDMPGFKNPNQLYYWEKIQTEAEPENLKASKAEKIRDVVWGQIRTEMNEALRLNKKLDFANCSVQGTFKSSEADKYMVEIANEGYRTLLIVPRTDLAMEHVARIEKEGGSAFVVMSFENLFKYLKLEFECPMKQDIMEDLHLGLTSTRIKSKYCKTCKYGPEGLENAPRCPYPEQYSNVKTTKKSIVIIQHAHMHTYEAMLKILEAHFDLMIIDETFVRDTYKYVKPRKWELTVLYSMSKKCPWIKRLAAWFKKPGERDTKFKRIEPTKAQLKYVYRKMRNYHLEWNVPDYIRSYNNGDEYDKYLGCFRFYPPPSAAKIPRSIVTDATLPFSLVKIVLNRPNMIRLGNEYLVNPKLYNPKNSFIKVLDSSVSTTALADIDHYEKILRFIAVKTRTEYQGLKILVTVYKPDIGPVEKFFKDFYPDIAGQIEVASGAVGINAWADVNVQFLLCGVHYVAYHYQDDAWEFNNIRNYWRDMDGLPLVCNHAKLNKAIQFPTGEIEKHPSLVNLRLSNTKRRAVWFKNEQLYGGRPKNHFYRHIERLILGISQQWIRIRTHDDRVKILWDFDGRHRPGILYTDYCLLNDVFAQAGIKEKDIEETF